MIRLLICWLVTAVLLVVTAGCGSENEKSPVEKKPDTKEPAKVPGRKKVQA